MKKKFFNINVNYMRNKHVYKDEILKCSSKNVFASDAWLSNMTYFIHEFSYNQQYGDPNSVLYKDFENLFCGDVSISERIDDQKKDNVLVLYMHRFCLLF